MQSNRLCSGAMKNKTAPKWIEMLSKDERSLVYQ